MVDIYKVVSSIDAFGNPHPDTKVEVDLLQNHGCTTRDYKQIFF